jgi:photosystem II stability/assembly factor-like uncharacterized protein
MFRFSIFLWLILTTVELWAQQRELLAQLEGSRNFHELCREIDQRLTRNRLEDPGFREGEFRNGLEGVFLDDDRLKFERWKYYWRDRVHEDGSFPDLVQSWEDYHEARRATSARSPLTTPVWQHEGPVRNTGGYWGMGRTTHVSFHPSRKEIFYVASPNGGIWKTLDGGKTYSSIAEDLPYQRVGIVLSDPTQSNVLYATLGEKEGWWQYSLGVYKTTDGGSNWKPTGLQWKLTDEKVIYALQMNPLNSTILIAATSDGLYKTFNGGNSWTKLQAGNFSDVVYKPGDTTVVYAASYDYWGQSNVYKSTDGGNQFVRVTDFGLQKVFLRLVTTPADPNYLGLNMSVDGEKRFYLSKNNASGFDFVSNMPENLVLYFSPKDKSILYCGYVVIYKSVDGGMTWNQITDWWASGRGLPEIHADHHFIGHHPLDPDQLYFGCDGGVYRYRESTEQWEELVNGLAITQFYKMDISMTNPPVLIGGSQDNGGWVRRSNQSWGNTNGGDAMSQVIDPSNPAIGYTEYWGGNAVYRTTNGFNNLTDITQNIGANLPGQWVTPFSLNPGNPSTFIIGYDDLFVSYDRGTRFVRITNNLTGSTDNDLREVRISPADTQFIVATRANICYTSKDFGKTWKSAALVTTLEITGVEFHPKNAQRIWCTRGGLGAVKVMESNNQGGSWSNITRNMPNVPVLCIRFDEPSNVLFLGTDFGVFYSDADDINWVYYGTGMPNTSVTDLKIHPSLRRLYASTYGRGFYSIDLPDCAPSSIEVLTRVDNGEFESKDKLKLCAGSRLWIKPRDAIAGSYRLSGPGLDTLISSDTVFDAGIISRLSQNGDYILAYTSPTGCIRTDTVELRVFFRPNFGIRSDAPQLDCHRDSVWLQPGMAIDTTAFTYLWHLPDGSIVNSPVYAADAAGHYVLELVNRAAQCHYYDTFQLAEAPELSLTETRLQHVRCHGDHSGSVSLMVTGGNPPYRYEWNVPGNSNGLDSLAAGKYGVRIWDANDCSYSAVFEVNEPEAYALVTDIRHSTGADGYIHVLIDGNTPPYRFRWSQAGREFALTRDIDNLAPGEYDLEIWDANDCYYRVAGIEVREMVGNSGFEQLAWILFPNPAGEALFLQTSKQISGALALRLFDLDGREWKLTTVQREGGKIQIDLGGVPRGQYLLRLEVNGRKQEWKVLRP